jgi:CRISPR-associated protein Cmr1
MSRSLPECPVAPAVRFQHDRSGLKRERFDINVITPLFGGGVQPGVNDPVTLIRPASIRGQLRFWWRATRGRSCPDVASLRRREGEIWGTTETPSKISIEVEIRNRGRQERCAEYPPDRGFPRFLENYPLYALFPFQGNKREGVLPALVRQGISFSVYVTFLGDLQEDLLEALWAWVNFGGIGARTRRGCGALFCAGQGPLEARLGETFRKRCQFEGRRAWPILTAAPLVRHLPSAPMRAWSDAVNLLRDFRQGAGTGRNASARPNQPGRSWWPEADSLRRITGKRDGRHQSSLTGSQTAFPRGAWSTGLLSAVSQRSYATVVPGRDRSGA